MGIVTETSNKTFRLIGSISSVLAIVIGIPCLLISWMPLLGALAYYPSLFAFVCAGVGLVMAIKAGSSTGASITGLVITLIALMFSWVWFKGMKEADARYEKRRQERGR